MSCKCDSNVSQILLCVYPASHYVCSTRCKVTTGVSGTQLISYWAKEAAHSISVSNPHYMGGVIWIELQEQKYHRQTMLQHAVTVYKFDWNRRSILFARYIFCSPATNDSQLTAQSETRHHWQWLPVSRGVGLDSSQKDSRQGRNILSISIQPMSLVKRSRVTQALTYSSISLAQSTAWYCFRYCSVYARCGSLVQ